MYHVIYDAPDGLRQYCLQGMTLETAREMLALFKDEYLDENGNGKPYPNGKGFYPFNNPRIVMDIEGL